ncbi:MAG: putative toxin-antitoxin system toxin component, PIN family [Chloroflexi bacterium]|nr:putative toxin-antitoxin system toxin component, PIN family [Chloroflexota bacterium]
MRSGSPKLVVDTNVLVSGTISHHGASAHILDAFRSGKVSLVFSGLLLLEFEDVIHRPHITERYPDTVAGIDAYIEYFKKNATWVEGIPTRRWVKDDIVVACAVEGDADYIVSGDRHLLELKNVEGISILTPAEFARRFKL